MRDDTARRLSRLHTAVFRLTRGRVGKRLVNNDMLLLTTRGRKTGRPRTVPLLYLSEGDRIVVIASWGGRDYHPEWYTNLLADPEAEVNLGGLRRRVVARTAGGADRAEWWQRAIAAYPRYAAYQRRTNREVPIVFLEPR